MGTLVFQGQSPYRIALTQGGKAFAVADLVRLVLDVSQEGRIIHVESEMPKMVALALSAALAHAVSN